MSESMQNSSGTTFLPFTQTPASVSPQGFDLGQFVQQIAGQAVQALPGVILGLLSTHPMIGKAQGVTPQSLLNIGVQTPFGGGGIKLFEAGPASGVSPQGLDLGKIGQQVLGEVVKALPGLIFGALSAHPVIGPQLLAKGVSPQSLINIGVQTPFGGGGASLFNSAPTPGVSPQDFDLGQLAQQVLPALIMTLLSANPTINRGAVNSGATH